MPTVLRWKGHKFLFYSREIGEPPHVHIIKDGKQLKVWLSSLKVAKSIGYSKREIGAIVKIVEKHRNDFLRNWNDHFGN